MMRATRTITISDGRTFTIRSPGCRYELELHGAIPDLGRMIETARAAVRAGEPELNLGALTRSWVILIRHGVESPKLSDEEIGDLLPPDMEALAGAIADLRRAEIARALEFYRPTTAGEISSEPSGSSAAPSDPGPPHGSGSRETSSPA